MNSYVQEDADVKAHHASQHPSPSKRPLSNTLLASADTGYHSRQRIECREVN